MQKDLFGNTPTFANLRILKCQAVEPLAMTEADLFETGHRRLRVLTYSASLPFLEAIAPRFAEIDVILGSEKVVSRQFAELAGHTRSQEQRGADAETDLGALGAHVSNYVKRHDALFRRVMDGSLRIYVNKGTMSHDKVFIMSDGDKPHRVFQGSANMTLGGFLHNLESGVLFCGDEVAFRDAVSRFEGVLGNCAKLSTVLFEDKTSETVPKAVIEDIFEEIGANATVYFQQADVGDPDITMRILRMPEVTVKTERGERTTKVTKDGIYISRKAMNRTVETLPALAKQPLEEGTIEVESLRGGREIRVAKDLWSAGGEFTDNAKMAQNDAKKLLAFLDNYTNFPYAKPEAPLDFWCAMIWFFSTPFIPHMRARMRANGLGVWKYPNHFIMLGGHNLGKTTFSEIALKTLYGHAALTSQMGKKAYRQAVRSQIGVYPYVMDDVKNSDFKSAHMFPDMVKSELHEDLAPTFTSSNGDAVGVPPDVRKRAMTIWLPFSPIPEERRNDQLAAAAKTIRGDLFRYWHSRHAESIAALQDDINPRVGETRSPDLLFEVGRSLTREVNALCPEFASRPWLRAPSTREMTYLCFRPFVDTLKRFIRESPDKVVLAEGDHGMELRLDPSDNKRTQDFFKSMSPDSAVIASPMNTIIYSVDVLREDYGITVTLDRGWTGMGKGKIIVGQA